MSKLSSCVGDHEETGFEGSRTAEYLNMHKPDSELNDSCVQLSSNCLKASCLERKVFHTETSSKSQDPPGSCTMYTDLQAEQPGPADSEEVMVVHTSAMGPYPMALLGSGSPMNKSVTSSTSGSICRICLEGDCVEELISPCDCMGSMGVVHICCLEKWLSTSNLDRCEVCKYQFKVRRTPRPIIQWIFSRQSRDGPHGFCGDALCLLLLTPICLTSVYLCGMGSLTYLQKGAWEGVGLAFLSLIVLFTFFLWGFTTIRFQWQSLSRWRMSNQTVHLVDHNRARRRRLGNSTCNAHRSSINPVPSSAIP